MGGLGEWLRVRLSRAVVASGSEVVWWLSGLSPSLVATRGFIDVFFSFVFGQFLRTDEESKRDLENVQVAQHDLHGNPWPQTTH